MSDGFLSRWSRRKRDEARRPPEVAPDATSVESVAVPAGDEGSLTPEELAQLPSLDDLTAATDLAPFLRAGVPRVLRNAALRRMWSIDPAIRDFVSEAREYAYDWNTPGGVPGTGGAISAEDVRAMVEKVFGAGEPSPENLDEDEVRAGSPPLQAMPGLPGIATTCGGEVGGEGDEPPDESQTVALPAHRMPLEPEPEPTSPLPLSQTGEGIPRFSSNRPEPEQEPSPSPPRLRRHGGALPI